MTLVTKDTYALAMATIGRFLNQASQAQDRESARSALIYVLNATADTLSEIEDGDLQPAPLMNAAFNSIEAA